jgi:hypothetical protein
MFLKKILVKRPLVVVWLFIALENVSALIESPSEDECPVSQPYNKIFLTTVIVEIPCYISIYVDEVTILNINDVYITINSPYPTCFKYHRQAQALPCTSSCEGIRA